MKKLIFVFVIVIALGMASGAVSRGQARKHNYTDYTAEQLAVRAYKLLSIKKEP
jgi:hypothetical protein